MKAFCLISHYPQECWMKFLNNFIFYDVFIIVDDNSKNYKELYGNIYHNIHFIQIDNDEYQNHCFIDKDFPNEKLSGWHKALYFFSKINNFYEYVWFCEDDVFFYEENTINNIDEKFTYSDLLSSPLDINETGSVDHWHWYKINLNFSPPFYKGMMCCVRMSHKLLQNILNYANVNKSLFYIEAMFPTVAKNNNLVCNTPDEMKTIHFRKDYRIIDINKTCIFHPIKKFELHEPLRECLDKKI